MIRTKFCIYFEVLVLFEKQFVAVRGFRFSCGHSKRVLTPKEIVYYEIIVIFKFISFQLSVQLLSFFTCSKTCSHVFRPRHGYISGVTQHKQVSIRTEGFDLSGGPAAAEQISGHVKTRGRNQKSLYSHPGKCNSPD